MAARKSLPAPGDYTFPATSGPVTGVVGIAMVVLVFVVLTFEGLTLGTVRVQIALVLFGLLTWALMLRPKIVVRGRMLHLVNPMEQISIPLHLIDHVVVRSVTKVSVGEKTYVGLAVGRKTRNMVRPASMSGSGYMFGMSMRRDDGAVPPRDKSADMLESWVSVAARGARLDVERYGTDLDGVRRERTWWLIASCLALALAFAVTLLL